MNLSQFPKLPHTEKRQEYPRVLDELRIKKVCKENATLKKPCERKKEIFKKFLNEHHIVAIVEHIGVFLWPRLQDKMECAQ